MRAYVDYIFNSQYKTLMTNAALSRGFLELGERTKVVCYEDLASRRTDVVAKAMNSVFDFFYSDSGNPTTTNEYRWQPPLTTTAEATGANHGGHGTSQDPALRNQLVQVIKEVDEEFFDGDVSFFKSMFPC